LQLPLSSHLFPYTTLFRSILFGQRSEFDLHANELGPRCLALLLEPVGVDQPRAIGLGVVQNCSDEGAFVGHEVLAATPQTPGEADRKSTRLNSSHGSISYA